MAFGEVGGPVSSLVLTCRTPGTGTVDIHRGDAVKLSGAYEISNVFETGDRIFGQALVDCSLNDAPVPVRVRGVCDFPYSGATPEVDGISGVAESTEAGKVILSSAANAAGLAVKANSDAGTVEVLL